jgi:multiple sugar transport system permease protein
MSSAIALSRTRTVRARRWRAIRPFLAVYLPVLPYILFALFPLYFMVVTSLKSNSELYDVGSAPFWITGDLTIAHYRLLSADTPFWDWFANSLIVSLSATVISVVLGVLAAYPLARMRFPGSASFGVAVFITYLVPPTLLFLPLTSVVNWLGLSDSLWALIVTYPTFLVPFCTWLLIGYFSTVPKEIEECAMLDGCNRFQSMFRILLPAAVPGLICAALFAFTLSWNEFLYALVFVSPAELKTMTVGVFSELIRGDIYYWGALMAGACIGSIPIVIAYVFFLDYYVSGLTSGAIK